MDFGPFILERIYKNIGSCSLLHLKEFHLCYEGGGEWDGLDISGHCFLWLHSSLLIWEELRDTFCTDFYNLESKTKNNVMIIGIGLMILLGMWFMMLLITVLYFHSLVEKVLGSILGVGFWYLDFCQC